MLKPLHYLLLVVLLNVGVAATAYAGPGSPDNDQLQLTAVPSKETYLQGEPIPVKVSISNVSTTPVLIAKPPLDYIIPAWDLRGEVKRPSGANITIFPGTRHQVLYPLKSTDFITLKPGESLDWTITAVASAPLFKDLYWDASKPDGTWQTSNALEIYFSEPGTYTFTLTLQNSVNSYLESQDLPGHPEEHILPTWTGTLQSPAKSITITPEKFQKNQ